MERVGGRELIKNVCYYQGNLGSSDHINPNCCHPINMVHTEIPLNTFVGKHIDV